MKVICINEVKHLNTLKRNRYISNLFQFGFITLCYLIDEYAALEDYEECSVILEAIQAVNEGFKLDLPTRFDGDAKKYFLNAKKQLITILDMDGKRMLSRIPEYAEIVKQDLSIYKNYQHETTSI